MKQDKKQGWYTCPKCGVQYPEIRHFCRKCNYYTPITWSSPGKNSTKTNKRNFIIFLSILVLITGTAIWIWLPFIPNPLVLFHRPTSDSNSISRPGEWAVYAHDAAHTRIAPLIVSPKGRIRWSRDLGEPTNSAPAVVDDVVFVGGYFAVHALDAATGGPIWRAETTGPVHSAPAVAGSLVFVGLLDGRVVGLERRTGALSWQFETGGPVFGSGVAINGALYIGSDDRSLYALDTETGRLLWQTETGGGIKSTPAIADEILYVSAGDRTLYSLNAGTGTRRLRFRTIQFMAGSPVVANNLVYFPSGDGHLYTIRHGSRETPGEYELKWIWAQLWLWHLPVPRPPPQAGSVWRISPAQREKGFTASPAVTPEALYIGDQQGWFYSFDATKGTNLWKFKAGARVSASPLVLGDRVYFGSEDGHLYVLNRHTGRLIWKLFLNAPTITSPVYASGLILLRTADGKLHAID